MSEQWWRAALTPAEQAGEVPSWVARVRTTRECESPAEDLTAVVRPLAEQAGDDLIRLIPGGRDGEELDVAAIRAGFVGQVARTLAGLAARVLVFELNVTRVRGRLSGDSPADRFRGFVADTRRNLPALLREYPVLGRVLGQACEHAVDAGAELLSRFAADRAELGELLGAAPGKLVGFAAVGDPHLRGRTVSVLAFADGAKVVYRPRPVQAHLHFNAVVDWLNERVPGLGLGTVRALAKEGYGWAEFVEPAPCTRQEQVSRFYRRQGALLALLNVLNGTDIHHENLIARADQPLIVDLETLLHPGGLAGPPVADPAMEVLRDSVRRTALLPQFVVGDRGALDVSGLGGDKEEIAPFSAVAWEDAGTDTMRLVRRSRRFAGAANRPVLAGADADPHAYAQSLVQGFQSAYRAIAAGRDELLGTLRRFARDQVRVVVRQSRVYAELLDESTHPDVMRRARARDEVFHLLATMSDGDPVLTAAVPYEVSALWAGDIPLFRTRGDSLELFGRDEGRPVISLAESGLDAVARKVAAMGPADLADQEWIIRASLAARVTGEHHPAPVAAPSPPAPAPPHPELLLAAARDIAEQLCADLHSDGRRVNWLGLEPVGRGRWEIMPLGGGLATGYTGVALFLAQASHATGVTKYRDVAVKAVAGLPQLLHTLAAHPDLAVAVGLGGFSGLGGIAYALTRLSALLDDPGLTTCLSQTLDLVDTGLTGRAPLDVHDGLAGCLAALLTVHRATGLARARTSADRCAEVLAARSTEEGLPAGFAFGSSGVGWALCRAGHDDLGLRLLAEGRAGARGLSWCRGVPGALLAYADAGQEGGHDVLAGIGDARPQVTHDLCHGELGRIELLTTLAGRGDPRARVLMNRHAGFLLASLDRFGPRCGTPDQVATPGLLAGLAGIGHGLLRLADPGRIPALLLLR
ncbi:type 2 lanthipeptide synthetase LanM family protein [Nonomuraea sp. NPDC048826]|uniref:type 2 lanthipeptide synthetase LanM family protein n=1 Tax=Nonomuraea sp. NPDC048826 TaxID=3364347 RepID=UPI0037210154